MLWNLVMERGDEDERECKVMRINCWIGVWVRRRWQERKRRISWIFSATVETTMASGLAWCRGVGRSWVGWGGEGGGVRGGWGGRGCGGGGGRRRWRGGGGGGGGNCIRI